VRCIWSGNSKMIERRFSNQCRIFLGMLSLISGFLYSLPVRSQTPPTRAEHSTIILELRDGRTGWPIWRESPNVRVGSMGKTSNPMTSWKGQVSLYVDPSGPQEVYVLPNWYFDCRFKKDEARGYEIGYSVEQIKEQGIVSSNTCGKRQAKPAPGVLVLYVRPRTWLEAFAL
jgi:hypothetical protein